MTVIQLPSGRTRDSSENLRFYIEDGEKRSASILLENNFSNTVWTVTKATKRRVGSAHKSKKLWFTTHAGGQSKTMNGRVALVEPFASFVKSFIAHRHDTRPKTPDNHAVSIRACRYLYDSLSDRAHNPCELTSNDFTNASRACRAREDSDDSVYRIGVALVEISETLVKYSLSMLTRPYVNPFERPDNQTRIGAQAAARADDKLPSDAVFAALADLSRRDASPDDELTLSDPDRLRLRATELLEVCGFRINGLLALPEDSWVESDVLVDGKPTFDENGKKIVRCGIRTYVEKLKRWDTKWLVTSTCDVARRALDDIKKMTQSARDLAAWNEANPGRAYLPENIRGKKKVSIRDIEEAFGLARNSGLRWASTRKLDTFEEHGDRFVDSKELEEALLRQTDNPAINGELSFPLSKHLFLVHLNFYSSNRATNPALVTMTSDQNIGDFICGRANCASVFERYGYLDDAGNPLRVTSHQFRHWLDTLAVDGGLPDHLVAKWFGRKSPEQNASYDHISGIKLAREVQGLLAEGKMQGGIANVHNALPPVERAKFRGIVIASAHTSDIGICLNDWAIAPCHSHGECGGCKDHLVVKGDVAQRDRTEVLYHEQLEFIAKAKVEEGDGTYGASSQLEHAQKYADALEEIIKIHDDPSIANGTLVHARPS